MAWNSAYATAAEYRERTGKSSTGDDADVLEQLTAMSRILELCAHDVWNKTASGVVRYFNGMGIGRGIAIEPSCHLITKVQVDTNGDGNYETNMSDLTDLIELPQSVEALDDRPVKRLELHPKQSTVSQFPARRHSVEVTATFGWAAVPDGIREACVSLTREMRDLQLAGFTLTLQNIDAAVSISPDVARIISRIENEYGRADVAGAVFA